jgi:hypothetical protein
MGGCEREYAAIGKEMAEVHALKQRYVICSRFCIFSQPIDNQLMISF